MVPTSAMTSLMSDREPVVALIFRRARLVRLAMTAWDDSEGGATFHALLRWIATDDSAPEAVQAYATEQILDLIAHGVEHIHIYTMNKPEVAAKIMDNLSCILRPHG